MNYHFLFALTALLCSAIASAEPRPFTNTKGKTIQAELVAVNSDSVTLKLENGRMTDVALKLLSEEDQTFIKQWQDENKNKISPSDVQLKIDKVVKRIPQATKDGKKDKKNKTRKDETSYTCTLGNYSSKKIADISVTYTIYKRARSRDSNGTKDNTEEITGSGSIVLIEPKGTAIFKTEKVTCEDITKKASKGKDDGLSQRETIIGFVVSFSVGDDHFLTQSYPDNFIQRLEEAKKRKSQD